MLKKKNTPFFVFIILTLLFSCENNELDNELEFNELRVNIETIINQGSLLRNITEKENDYLLEFESGIVKVAKALISEIEVNKKDWETSLIYHNGKKIIIPTIGDSINSFIVNTIINPSGYNPLSAQIVLNFPTLGKVKLVIHSKEKSLSEDIEYSFKSVEKVQSIPILGLYQNYNNKVSIIYTDKEGLTRGETVIEIPIGNVKHYYLPSRLNILKAIPDKMEPGMNLINSPGESNADTSIPYMVDTDGEIRWILDWSNSPILKNIGAHCGLHRLRNGNYVIGDVNNHLLAEVNILGEIVQKWDLASLGYTFHHEVSEAKNGNFLVAVSKNIAKIQNGKDSRIYDHIIELDPISGSVKKEWDLVNMLDSSRYDFPGSPLGQTQSNWLHNNALTTFGDDYLANGRYQGIFKFDLNGELKWIISAHKNWKEKYHKYLLQPLKKNGEPITDSKVISGEKNSDEFEWTWGGHSSLMMPNGNILVFDNGYGRNFDSNSTDENNLYSRIVEYEINENNKTIRQVWQYGKERGRECYAPAVSNVQYLSQTGNRLFSPGLGNTLSDGNSGARVIEINPETNQEVFELEISAPGSIVFHRALRISLYPDGL